PLGGPLERLFGRAAGVHHEPFGRQEFGERLANQRLVVHDEDADGRGAGARWHGGPRPIAESLPCYSSGHPVRAIFLVLRRPASVVSRVCPSSTAPTVAG